MKKMLTLFTVLAFLLTSAGSAQSSMDFGFKVGGNRAKMSGDPSIFNLITAVLTTFTGAVEVDNDARIGLVGGAFLTINTSPNFSIQPEFLYSTKGMETKFRYTFNSVDYETVLQIKLIYVEIPVLLKYKFSTEGNLKPSFYFGPALGLNVSGNFTGEEGSLGGDALDLGELDISNLTSTEFSAVIGGELGIAMGNTTLLLDLRYTAGLTTVFDDASFATAITNSEWAFVDDNGIADDMKNSGFSLSVGVSFPIGGN